MTAESFSIGALRSHLPVPLEVAVNSSAARPRTIEQSTPVVMKVPKRLPLVSTNGKLATAKVQVNDVFSRRQNSYCTMYAGRFWTYVVKMEESGQHLLKLITSPPILREGFVCFDKQVYFVTLDDLRRGIVRKSRHLSLAPRRLTYDDFINGTAASSAYRATQDRLARNNRTAAGTGASEDPSTGSANRSGGSSVLISNAGNPSDSGGFIEALGDDEPELVDRAFQEQIHALLSTEGPQEWDWEVQEVPDHPQSR